MPLTVAETEVLDERMTASEIVFTLEQHLTYGQGRACKVLLELHPRQSNPNPIRLRGLA